MNYIVGKDKIKITKQLGCRCCGIANAVIDPFKTMKYDAVFRSLDKKCMPTAKAF